MKHIIKVNDIQDAKDNPTRPIIALDNSGILFAEGKAAGPQIEFIDLGLSVKWGNANLGATNGDTAESWYGNYYAWGETETKNDYSNSNYKFGASSPFSKYDGDGKTVLESVDDVATVTKSAWRMPTKAELEELLSLPNEWVENYNSISGLNGRVFTGINGNTLFIPAAGFHLGSNIYDVGSFCYLGSSSLSLSDYNYAYYLYFKSNKVGMNIYGRFYGYSVRPIC